ncbi:hypothetical protein KUCAC02_026905, partial [Chaenocephalus aceratus]
ASGSKLNVSKTQAQFYGPWTETIGLPLTVTQTEQKILGIKFDNEGGGKTNWTSLEREPVSPVHGLAFGEPSTVWCNVNHPTLTNRLRDMSWMVAHEILPVRSVMHSRGMAVNSTCPRPGCGAPETVRHLLWECSAAVDQWAKAGSLRFPCLPAREDLTAQLILYGVSQKQDCSRDFSKQWLTLAAIKDAIWTSRNLLVRRHMQIPPVAVIQMAAATIKSATRHAQDTATKKNRLCAHSDEGAGATRERSKQRRPDSPGGLL